MWNFLKKKEPELPPKKCDHKYKDFAWYINCSIEEQPPYSYRIEVVEPYVCLFCKRRINKVLTSYTGTGEGKGEKELLRLRRQFGPRLKPKEEIEDEINDMTLVDREYLDIYHILHPNR